MAAPHGNTTLALAGLSVCAAAVVISGCIGVSQKRGPVGVVGGDIADLNVCRAGTRVGDDGMIDDFEDGNTQISLEGGRDGYWWTKKDKVGATVDPTPFAPSEGGAGSEMGLRAMGKTVKADGGWGAGFGFNLVTQGVVYDASKYAGIVFKARVADNSTRHVRLKLGDINTHEDGHICKSCWNHFGKDLSLTPEWKEYRVLFTEVRQEEFWGDPRPPALTPGKLISIDWSIGMGETYDIWIDDLAFISCK